MSAYLWRSLSMVLMFIVKALKNLRLQMIQNMTDVISSRCTVESFVAEWSQYLSMARYLDLENQP